MKFLKIFLSVIAVILAGAIIALCVMGFYYPKYIKAQGDIEKVDVRNLEEGEIRVMSCNLRCMTPNDLLKKSWFYRADLIMKNIAEEKPSVIGFQEATVGQYEYMKKNLKGYDSVIKYRDDSPIKEGTPIFYRTDLYEIVDKDSFWLSETPDKMSKDWGAACYRICSYAILKDKRTQKEFVVFNTHLDHVSDEARIKGIGVVLDKIKEFGSLPAILMGDFNAEENTQTYISATQSFDDVKHLTGDTQKQCTYQNWGTELDSDCIDYIMISKTGFEAKSYKVVTTTYDNVYPSDHFQLVSVLKLK